MDQIDQETGLEDLITAIEKALRVQDEEYVDARTITAPEASKLWGISKTRARGRLNLLAEQGVVSRAWVRRVDGWGKRGRVQGYRLADQP